MKQGMRHSRYMRLLRGGLRAIGKVGRWTGIAILVAIGAIFGIIAFMAIGGMGLALLGTAIGIGPVGWASIMVVAALAIYGGACLLRRH